MSDDIYTLVAEERKDTGKGASRRLRHQKRVPAIIYGCTKAQKPMPLTLDSDAVKKSASFESFFSHVLTLQIGSKTQQAIVMDMQRHPSRGWVTHIDFQRVTKNTKVHKSIPVHFLNEETCPGIKAGGVVQHNLSEVEITCKASDLPEYLEVDLASMNIGDVIHLSDLEVPKGVTIMELTHGEDHDAPVCSILGAPKIEEDKPVEEEAEGEEDDSAEESEDKE